MASRHTTRWGSTHKNIQQAQALIAKYDADKANPKDFLGPLPAEEQAAWDDLLNRIE